MTFWGNAAAPTTYPFWLSLGSGLVSPGRGELVVLVFLAFKTVSSLWVCPVVQVGSRRCSESVSGEQSLWDWE